MFSYMYNILMPPWLPITEWLQDEADRCLLLADNLSSLVHDGELASPYHSFERSYRLCYNVCVYVKSYRSCLPNVILPFAFERAAMILQQQDIPDCHTRFHRRVDVISNIMMYWCKTSGMTEASWQAIIKNVAETSWRAAEIRVTQARSHHAAFVVCLLMRCGFSCDLAVKIQRLGME